MASIDPFGGGWSTYDFSWIFGGCLGKRVKRNEGSQPVSYGQNFVCNLMGFCLALVPRIL